MIDLYDAMSTLRAVRRLRTDPIPAEVLDRVLQAACWAPTGGNQQPWRIVAVQDDERKRALQDIYAPEWRNYTAGYTDRLGAMDEKAAEALRRTLSAGDYLAEHLAEAPVILVFCADFRAMAVTDAKLDRRSLIGGASVYPAVQNLMLACVAEGLGCTLTTLHCIRESEVMEILGIPEPWATAALVPIGYPVGKGHGSITRKPIADMVFRNAFGEAW